jgi:predicted heme/steroid binding protein
MRKYFVHEKLFDCEELGVENGENGRFYITPDGKRYPSVTTVLSLGTDQSWKEKWIKRVGEDKAKSVSKKATVRGESVHGIAENYLSNKEDYKASFNPFDVENFESIRPVLDKNIGKIYALEVPLYSHLLRTAGRVDCIAEWNGTLSIVDFKTSKKLKKIEHIQNYLLQKSAYAYMVYELFGLPVTQIVTAICVDHESPQIFVKKTKDYLPMFIEIRNSLDI